MEVQAIIESWPFKIKNHPLDLPQDDDPKQRQPDISLAKAERLNNWEPKYHQRF